MKSDVKRKPARLDESSRGRGEVFIEFELDPATLHEVEALASNTGCTPFQMSVNLLKEGLSRASAN